MKYLRGIWLNVFVAFILCATAASAGIVSTISGFTQQADGNTIHASDWNTAIGSIYTYINANLVAAFNVMTTKGDLISTDGAAIVRVPAAASNNFFLVSDSAQTANMKWAAAATTTALTTKGDLLTYHTAALQRLPVGIDGQVLTARASATPGVAWESGSIPAGVIVMWSGSIATVPSGWHLCDGTTGTPNLQGLFVVGAGNVSPPATGGMGLVAPGGPSGDTSAGTGLGPSHTHSIGLVIETSIGTGGSVGDIGALSTGSATITPRYYALAYIQKT